MTLQVHGDHFINEGKTIRDQELENLKRHLRKTFWDRDRWWVMLFPEGGFLYKRLESSQRLVDFTFSLFQLTTHV
jgi:lysophosphatidylglycerol acyltransferase 1